MPVNFSPQYYFNSREMLDRALMGLPAYQSWRKYDPGNDFHIDRRYAAMPALTKANIREHFPGGFVPAGKNVEKGLAGGEIQFVQTSGTSDAVRVTNIWNQAWWDASERASWKLNAHTMRLAGGDNIEAILANPRNVGIISDDEELPPEKRRLARFLYLNEKTDPARWTPAYMDRMLAELETFKPGILEANPSLLARLCRYAHTAGKKTYQPGLITFTYEYPSALHLKQIKRVFQSPLASSYGTTETGYVFMQCEAGKFHQNSEYCRVDLQPLKAEHGGPQVGRILVTTFKNPWYHMLRFDVGDLGRIDTEQSCSCGRDAGLILSAIEGRFVNATLDSAGRLVTVRTLDEAMAVIEGLDEYRLEQRAGGTYELHLACDIKNRRTVEAEALKMLLQIYGQKAHVSIIHEAYLGPEDTGKYTLAKTLFPLDINDFLAKPHTAEKQKY